MHPFRDEEHQKIIFNVKLEDGSYKDIIKFYNSVYIVYMNDYLEKLVEHKKLILNTNLSRIPNLNPSTPLKQNLFHSSINLQNSEQNF